MGVTKHSAPRRKPTKTMVRALRWLDGADVERPQKRTLDALVRDGYARRRQSARPEITPEGYDVITYEAREGWE